MTEHIKTDEEWMQFAYEQAALAAAQGEIPVGAIIVSNNKIIGRGFNSPISLNDPTAHAEIVAIREACQAIQNYRLPEDAVLYVTLEPCTMCVGALVHSRISKVVFGATEPKAGSLVSVRQLFETGYYNHVFEFSGGCLQEECSQQLSAFFKMRREQKKQLKLQERQVNDQNQA
ncbi:tRNA adenosine(34) deaminase TadA [Acinetobacter sp. LoGeW2-3]|uniref:tRNA adenosine(34) deaminase TadA n=1 Tax=Acinetobacter sp. LoGeW2-3 TaxID=1808001 RepID=UPI000C05B9E0|nr:tRNA adenosine(34) deaminase TadA [Acinetobacter sp. LoGeW2-3]ATO20245.1 tRNA adenosine(34) deaminase TadA [Acinetobacter sp. LoGeW2-3]